MTRIPPAEPRRPRRTILAVIIAASVALHPAAAQIEDVQVIQGSPAAPPIVGPGQTMARVPQVGTASLSGAIVSADGGRPVRRATVRLSSLTPAPPMTTVADDQGRFTFTKLPAGRFTLIASKPGYLDSTYGQRRAGSGRPGTPISVADGQHLDRLSVPLARGGVLAGTVMDDGGEPAFGAEVRAYRYSWQSGERRVRLAGAVKADDRGQYRIGALFPGDYVVVATPPGSPAAFDQLGVIGTKLAFASAAFSGDAPPVMMAREAPGLDGYAPVFFPGSMSSQNATVLTIEIGEERAGIDIQMPFVATGQVTGVVTSQGQPSPAVQIHIANVDDVLAMTDRTTMTGPDGSFTFLGLAPGRYRLDASAGPKRRMQVEQANGQTRVMMQFMNPAPPGGRGGLPPPDAGPVAGGNDQGQLWAGAEVVVGGQDTQRVALSLEPGVTISGRVSFDGAGQPPANLSSITIVLNAMRPDASGMGSLFGQVAPDGTFSIAGVVPGQYRPVVLAGPWRARRFEVQGQDVLDALLDVQPGREVPEVLVALTTRLGTVSGRLTDPSGQPSTGSTIVLFAEDPAYWTPQSRRIAATRPATDGRFTLSDLPAGRYRLAALEDVDEGQWFDPALLRQLTSAAIPIELSDGASLTQDIRLAR